MIQNNKKMLKKIPARIYLLKVIIELGKNVP